jgi:hypothetical protein
VGQVADRMERPTPRWYANGAVVCFMAWKT